MSKVFLAKLGASLAGLFLISSMTFMGISTADPQPQQATSTVVCKTNSSGVCSVTHDLGSVPSVVQLTPVYGSKTRPFTLAVVSGSLTSTKFNVRAVFVSNGSVAANVNIRFGWTVFAGAPAETTTPTTTDSSTQPPTDPTIVPTTTTPSVTTTTEPPVDGVPAVNSYVKPGAVGFQGNTADLTVVDKTHMPDNCHWDSGEYSIVCVGDLTLDHVWVKGGVYWDSDGTLTIKNSIIDSGDTQGKWTVRGFGHSNCLVDIEDSTLRWAVPHESTMQAASVLTDCRQKMVRNDVSGGDSGFIFYRDGDQAVGNYIHDFRLIRGLSHNDGIFVGGGANVLLQQNYIDVGWDGDCQTAALFWQGSGMDNNKVYANYLAGGGYTVANEAAPSVDFQNNTFGDADYGTGDPAKQQQYGLSSTRNNGSFVSAGNVKTSGGSYNP